jgi:hypothetical protein
MTGSKTMKYILAAFTLALGLMSATKPAAAVPANQILKIIPDRTIVGKCCFLWDETVTITEPKVLVPVVVTFSVDFQESGSFLVQLSVNNRPCQAFGPNALEFDPDRQPLSHTFEWIINPEDGLMKGTNTFTLCGGDMSGNPNPTLIIGSRTLSVTVSK